MNRLQVYCSLKNIITDDDGYVKDNFKTPSNAPSNPKWVDELMLKELSEGKGYYLNMKPKQDYDILVNHLNKNHPTWKLLVSTGEKNMQEIQMEQTLWCIRKLKQSNNLIFSVRDVDKWNVLFMSDSLPKDSILIDTDEQVVKLFIAKGGKGIVHTSVESTIEYLKDLNTL